MLVAMHIINILSYAVLDWKTQLKKLMKKVLSYDHLQVCLYYALNTHMKGDKFAQKEPCMSC